MVLEDSKYQFPVYYFDRLKIFMPRPTFSFGGPVIQNAELKNLCLQSKIRSSFMGCTLDIHLPNEKCLPFLHNRLKKVYYYISYLEITADFPCKSRLIAKSKTRAAAKKIVLKNNSHFKYFRGAERIPRGRFFDNKIWYWGKETRNMRFVMYPSYSKPAMPSEKIPCVHIEWRLRKSWLVKKYTGANTIQDLMEFDFYRFFSNHCGRFLQFLKIDHKMHGFHLLTSESNLPIYNIDERITDEKAEDISRRFCRKHAINHPVHFKNHYKKNAGIQIEDQKRRLSDYRVNSLLEEVRPPSFFYPLY